MLKLRSLKPAILAAALLVAAPALAQQLRTGQTNGSAPANTVGANGDYFLDTSRFNEIYGPKASGAWPSSPSRYLLPNIVIPQGMDPTYSTDSTAALQAALNSGAGNIYIPPGSYKLCGVTIPNTSNLHIWGAGTATLLYPNTGCLSPIFSWGSTPPAHAKQTISDVEVVFNNTVASSPEISVNGASDVALDNLYLYNVPKGYAAISIGGTATYVSARVRIDNLKAYGDTTITSTSGGGAGSSAISVGNYANDVTINNAVVHGESNVNYGLQVAAGATNVKVSTSHMYNTTGPVVYATGGSNITLNDDIFDYAGSGSIVSLTNTSHVSMNGGYIQGINPGLIGINISGGSYTSLTGVKFNATGGSGSPALSAIKDDATSSYTTVMTLDIGGTTSYSGTIVDLHGTGDFIADSPAAGGALANANTATSVMATSGTGGVYVCLDGSGNFYKKATACP